MEVFPDDDDDDDEITAGCFRYSGAEKGATISSIIRWLEK